MILSRTLLLCLLPFVVAGNTLRGNTEHHQVQRALNEGPDLKYKVTVQMSLTEDGEEGSASPDDLSVLEENVLAWQMAATETADFGDDMYSITNVTIAMAGAGYYPLREQTHEAIYTIGIYFLDHIAPNDTDAFMEELASEASEGDLVDLLVVNGGDSKFADVDTVVIASVEVTLDPNFEETGEIRVFNETYILPLSLTWAFVVLEEDIWPSNKDYQDIIATTKEWIGMEFDELYPPASSEFAFEQVEASLSEVSFTPEADRYDHTVKLSAELFIKGNEGEEGLAAVPTAGEFVSAAQLDFSVGAFVSMLKENVLAGFVNETASSPFLNVTQTAFRMDTTFEVATLEETLGRDEDAEPDADPLSLGTIHFSFP